MSTQTRKNAVMIAAIALFFIVLGIAGHYDYQDQLRDQQAYCDNVKAGYWPDYNGNAKEVCQ